MLRHQSLKIITIIFILQTLFFELSLPVPNLIKFIYFLISVTAFTVSFLCLKEDLEIPGCIETNIYCLVFFIVLTMSLYLISPLIFGDFNIADPDWKKHNLILFELFKKPLSPKINFDSKEYFLCYYYASYIIPALLIKIVSFFPIAISNSIILKLLVFTYSLFFLLSFYFLVISTLKIAMLNFLKDKHKDLNVSLIFFLFFAGMDYWPSFMWRGPFVGLHNEWNSPLKIQYSSIITLIEWVPQHLLTAMFILAVIFCLIRRPKKLFLSYIFLLPYACASSMWVAIGLFLFIPVSFVFYFKHDKRASLIGITGGLILSAPILLFYDSKVFSEPSTFHFIITSWDELFFYLIFIFCEIGFPVLVILVYGLKKISQAGKFFTITLFAGSIFFPLYFMGGANEFVMRGALIYQIGLAIIFAVVMQNLLILSKKKFYLISISFLILIVPQSINEYFFVMKKIIHNESLSFSERIHKPDHVKIRIITNGVAID